MENSFKICIAQMCSSDQHSQNIDSLNDIADYALANKCQLIALPEASGLMNQNVGQAKQQIVTASQDPFIAHCQLLAKRDGIWIHTGSTPVKGANGKFLNQTQCIDNKGIIRSTYNKIHLFDAFLSGQKAITESDRYEGGNQAVIQNTPWGDWGMAICYDLRFGQLFRQYAKAGVSVVFVPSAFTLKTGAAHWETLLRARAIENGLWIIAAAQVGKHSDGRSSWGHSLVINPWGEVCADLGGTQACCTHVTIDINQVEQVRLQIPSLDNERPYTLTVKS